MSDEHSDSTPKADAAISQSTANAANADSTANESNADSAANESNADSTANESNADSAAVAKATVDSSPNASPIEQTIPQTPLPVIANVSRIVTKVVDRLTGDRSDYPLMVAAACSEALKCHGIESRIMYGKAAWIEVMENHAIQWAGCWGDSFTFWVSTPSGELIDLNASVAYKKRVHSHPDQKPILSPPILWSREVPKFYRYVPEGIAELELFDERDVKRYEAILEEIREKCVPAMLQGDDEEFPNEPILCPGRKLLDDSHGNFKMYDRTLAVTGIPDLPDDLLKPSQPHTHHHPSH